MAKYRCPKCKKLRSCIHHGKLILKSGRAVQRIRCLSPDCNKTSTVRYQHSFLNKMHTCLRDFHEVIALYSSGNTIKDVASKLRKRPNTIIDWVRKVKAKIHSYRSCLKTSGDYTNEEIESHIYAFKKRAIEKRRVSKRLIGYIPTSTYKRSGRTMYS